MRVLFITNLSTLRCGVREYGAHFSHALDRQGITVDTWDGTYPSAVRFGYLPPPTQLATYDLVHLNWDPQAINHYLPEHFDGAPPLSLFLHDVPPNSTCPVLDRAQWVIAFEPVAGRKTVVIPEGIPATPIWNGRPSPRLITIGTTGIRDDPGVRMVADLCARRGWIYNGVKDQWLPTAEEIQRLGASTVNVCWYQATGRSKSMGAMYCCAARRPLVLSASTMFSALWGYEDEIYIDHDVAGYHLNLERMIDRVLQDMRTDNMAGVGCARTPNLVCRDLSWDRVIEPVVAAWRS